MSATPPTSEAKQMFNGWVIPGRFFPAISSRCIIYWDIQHSNIIQENIPSIKALKDHLKQQITPIFGSGLTLTFYVLVSDSQYLSKETKWKLETAGVTIILCAKKNENDNNCIIDAVLDDIQQLNKNSASKHYLGVISNNPLFRETISNALNTTVVVDVALILMNTKTTKNDKAFINGKHIIVVKTTNIYKQEDNKNNKDKNNKNNKNSKNNKNNRNKHGGNKQQEPPFCNNYECQNYWYNYQYHRFFPMPPNTNYLSLSAPIKPHPLDNKENRNVNNTNSHQDNNMNSYTLDWKYENMMNGRNWSKEHEQQITKMATETVDFMFVHYGSWSKQLVKSRIMKKLNIDINNQSKEHAAISNKLTKILKNPEYKNRNKNQS